MSHGLSACMDKLTIHHPRGAMAPLMLPKSYRNHHRISEVGSKTNLNKCCKACQLERFRTDVLICSDPKAHLFFV